MFAEDACTWPVLLLRPLASVIPTWSVTENQSPQILKIINCFCDQGQLPIVSLAAMVMEVIEHPIAIMKGFMAWLCMFDNLWILHNNMRSLYKGFSFNTQSNTTLRSCCVYEIDQTQETGLDSFKFPCRSN